jgi:hypothetical protein
MTKENALHLIRMTVFEFHRDVMIPLDANVDLYDKMPHSSAVRLHEHFFDFSSAVQNLYGEISKAIMEDMDNFQTSQLLSLCRDISELYGLPVFKYMPGSIPDNSPIRYVDPRATNTPNYGLEDNTLEKLKSQIRKFGDEELTKRLAEVESGKSRIVFEEMKDSTEGHTVFDNGKVTYRLNKKYEKASDEADLWKASIILAHELQRNPATGDLRGETTEIVLRDLNFIEKLAEEYGEKVYEANPEFAILRYVNERFGEEGLKKFADVAISHEGRYLDWDEQFLENCYNGELSPLDVLNEIHSGAMQQLSRDFNLNLVTGPRFSEMYANEQIDHLWNLCVEAERRGGTYKGTIAAHIRNDLRNKMKLDDLFAIDDFFMNGRLRELLNVNENGEDYYNFGDMKLTSGWYKVPSYGSHYHQNIVPRTTRRLRLNRHGKIVYKVVYTRLNAKFMNFDKREAVFRYPGGVSDFIDSGPDRGTYNYFNGLTNRDKHERFDVEPFKKYSPAGYDEGTLIFHNKNYSRTNDNSFYWRY